SELIDALARIVASGRAHGPDIFPEGLAIGIGDDCAAIRRDRGTDVYTTDTMVDGVHFRAGQMPWRDLGWKSMASNQSDVASMGAWPVASLVTLGVPREAEVEDLQEIYGGMKEAVDEHGGAVVGGDVVRSPVLFITVAMIGRAEDGSDGEARLLRRDVAKAGDLIAVTGVLGSSAGGLRALESGLSGGSADILRNAHFRPTPRVPEGLSLARDGVRTAMDVSDGLVADTAKLCQASGVCAVVNRDALPVADALRTLFPDEWPGMALGGGEDYELLFAAPPDVMEHALRSVGGEATVIGEILACEHPDQHGKVRVVDSEGREVPVEQAGWDHLRQE
ncbi:MAG: thiamine-phosphate kinase, partial [Chloroflexota bacterium]